MTRKERINYYEDNSEDYLPRDIRNYRILVIQLSNEIIKKWSDAHYRSDAERGVDIRI